MLYVVDDHTLRFEGRDYVCAIGKAGFVSVQEKREGDLKTPIGSFVLRECWYRPDKVEMPDIALAVKPITRQNGWCDDPSHPDYNRHVSLPFDASHETLWREEDKCYDIVIPLGYNDDPPVPGKGSAIFLHVAKPDYDTTEGCVALAKADLLAILPSLDMETRIHIMPEQPI